jgi:hypothetical protein
MHLIGLYHAPKVYTIIPAFSNLEYISAIENKQKGMASNNSMGVDFFTFPNKASILFLRL